MQLGDFRLSTISGGRFFIDGGTMFGVVPKALWNRVLPADEANLIPQATSCVLVESDQRKILIDTGYGSKLDNKQQRIFRSEPGDPLLASLAAHGTEPDEIDTVVLSHLHFDHAGGATRINEAGELVPAFPNAEYIAGRIEWETATADLPELRGAYPQENLLPLEASGQLRLVERDGEIVPGLRRVLTGGHTRGHMAIYIESNGETAAYLADICPLWGHLPSLWCMAYDVDLLQTRRIKPKLLGEIADNDWIMLSDHDPQFAAAKIERDPKRDFVLAQTWTELSS